jgi:hypothetical protein
MKPVCVPSRHAPGAFLLLLVMAVNLAAQSPPSAAARVSPNALRAYIGFLADDALEGRGTGSRGGRVAAEFVAAQFRRLGLTPAGDSGTYLQAVPLLGRTPAPTVTIGGKALRYPTDYVVSPVSDDTLIRVSGDIVFAGYGIASPARKWDDYKGVDVRGKVVLVLPGDPDSTLFDRVTGRPWNAVREKADVAARRGAAALLVVQSDGRRTVDAGADLTCCTLTRCCVHGVGGRQRSRGARSRRWSRLGEAPRGGSAPGFRPGLARCPPGCGGPRGHPASPDLERGR